MLASLRPRYGAPSPRYVGRVALCALVLLALVGGSLSHLHASRGATSEHCTACALHETTSVSTTSIGVAAKPTFELAEAIPCARRPHLDPSRTLLEAPKTSPPVS